MLFAGACLEGQDVDTEADEPLGGVRLRHDARLREQRRHLRVARLHQARVDHRVAHVRLRRRAPVAWRVARLAGDAEQHGADGVLRARRAEFGTQRAASRRQRLPARSPLVFWFDGRCESGRRRASSKKSISSDVT
eukprot:384949-Prymnesium_polylepis.1